MSAPILSANSVRDWHAKSRAGAVLIYHSGHSLSTCPFRRALDAVRGLYDAGLIDLVQRRREDRCLDYLAIKRAQPAKIAEAGKLGALG